MGSERAAGTAIVTFGSARQAERRVAGVAAVARIVREAAVAGVAETWLVLPAGAALGVATMNDLHRLSGAMQVKVTESAPASLEGRDDPGVLHLPGQLLIPAETLAQLVAGRSSLIEAEALELDRRGASAELLRQTGKPGDGPVSRWLNRPVSRRISALLLHVPGLRPIHATLGTALLAALMFAALVGGAGPGLIAGAILFQAASIFDGVDGEVARATFRTSPGGAMLDRAVDVATNVLLILGVTINLGLRGEWPAYLLGTWGLALFALGLATLTWRASRARQSFNLDLVKHHYRNRFSQRIIPLLIKLATIVSSRDFFAFLFMLLIVAGAAMAVLYIFAAAATVWIIFVLASLRRPVGQALA